MGRQVSLHSFIGYSRNQVFRVYEQIIMKPDFVSALDTLFQLFLLFLLLLPSRTFNDRNNRHLARTYAPRYAD